MLWFKHDSDARNDSKCRKLIKRMGPEAYGRWWIVCEMLADASDHSLHVYDDDEADLIADELCFDDVKSMRWFVGRLVDIGLLERAPDGGDWVTSARMLEQCQEVDARRERNRQNVMKRWEREKKRKQGQ